MGNQMQQLKYSVKAEQVKKCFGEKFWNAETNYLLDVIDEDGNPDSSFGQISFCNQPAISFD